ncbi:uncharacterized protein LOC119392421 [Rhipicephalus sanguineus]|uniref:Uncharacterized protein n=1 Tax=Rhipicephalus sanguineus TaxID=34632 RepID=A0A9D4TA12_RHISA|nr:uncharacterized protein LOC119392421 [Rhipicephalus sanguineus]KAH7983569.1 hypothetical protein HPB52_012657 [Rhipicephalus sanguineus]
MSSYQLPANASEDVLQLKIDEVQGNLQSLNISNCIVAQPAIMLSLLARLRNLQTLSCIACPLKASFLLDRLLRSLRNVTHLEFSLVDAKDYAREELINIRHLGKVHKGRVTNIRKLYVEIADEENMELLRSFLQYCPHVADLHIHFTHYVRFEFGVVACLRIVENQSELVAFTFTCEAPSTMQSEPTQLLELQYCIDIHGNVVFRTNPKAFSYALLRDLAASPQAVLPLEPAVLVAFETPHLERQLLDAGAHHDWAKLQSLCILLYARSLDETVYPAVDARYNLVLRVFFARLSNLVELNVSSFHFGDGNDFTELLAVSALQQLRALSLPPCGLRHSGAVRRLAVSSGNIEDLDIRVNLDGRHCNCTFCDNELVIEPADASAFRIGSGRLTLSNLPNLASLDFLQCLQVSHLRFIDVSAKPRFDYTAFSEAVRSNDNLRSLVVKFRDINFRDESFESSLRPAKALEHVCLLTKRELMPEVAEKVVESMALQLPSISYLHIHYVDRGTFTEASVTWIRLPESDTADEPDQGKVMQGKPCIMCSTQTFIALAKPRSREL